MKLELEIKIENARDVVRLAAITLTGIALLKELSKPPAERTWHGSVAGIMPYDFRPPTLERARESYWNPDNPSLFTPTLFGIGWALNIPVLARDVGHVTRDALGAARDSIQQWRAERLVRTANLRAK